MHQPSTTKTICFSRFVFAMPAFAYVINWQMKRFFLMGLITTRFFLFMLKLKWLKNGGAKAFIAIYIFFKIITLFIKYKSDIVFSVFFLLDQTLKELRNCILCVVAVWSLFSSVGVYIKLHFLPIVLIKLVFFFLGFCVLVFHVSISFAFSF